MAGRAPPLLLELDRKRSVCQIKTMNIKVFAYSVLGRADLRISASSHLASCSATMILSGPGYKTGHSKLFKENYLTESSSGWKNLRH